MLFSEKSIALEPNSLKIGDKYVEEVGTNCTENYFKFDCHMNFDNLLWGCANQKSTKPCIMNVALKGFRSHTEPLFKQLGILSFSDK